LRVLGSTVSSSFKSTGKKGLRIRGRKIFIFGRPPPLLLCTSSDVTWWQRWDFDLGLTVMQKERGVFFGQRTNLGSAPTPSEERKKSLLRAPHFVRIPTSKFHTVESWIPSTRTVARSLFTRTTIDKPPPRQKRKKKEANTEKFAFCGFVFLLKRTVPVCTAVRVTFPTRKNT